MSKGTGDVANNLYELLPLELFDEKIFVEASDDRVATDFYKKKGFMVLQEKEPKGALLKRAVDTATSENIVMLGTDGSDDPRDLNLLLIQLKQGYDLVIASRFMPGGRRLSNRFLSYRSMGNRFFTFLLSVLYGRNISDCNNLFRGFKKKAFEGLKLKEKGESITFEMTLKALSSDLRFSESPTTERPTLAARSRRNRFLSALSFCWILLNFDYHRSHERKS
jgi:hypothetical protein